MPLFAATWKVTHNSVILLDFTDYMEREPEIDRAFISDRFAALGASGSGINYLGRQNVFHTITFSQVRVFDIDTDARKYMRDHVLLLSSAPFDCTIELLGRPTSETKTLHNAVIASYRSRCENNHFMADYSLNGGLMT